MTGGHFTSFQIGVYPIVNIYWGWFIIGLTTFIVVIQCFFLWLTMVLDQLIMVNFLLMYRLIWFILAYVPISSGQ